MDQSAGEQTSCPKILMGTLEKLTPQNILVFGDFFLDAYTVGHVGRLSPEAPVPVLQHSHEFVRAGGAGNVALNLRALGNRVWVLGRIGDDLHGTTLKSQLEGIDTAGLQCQSGFSTPLKHRILADHQQLLRIDQEQIQPLTKTQEEDLLNLAGGLMSQFDALAISDYGKGTCTTRIVTELIKRARAANCPVIVDPKGGNWGKYSRATVVKPNLAELSQIAQLHPFELRAGARAFFEHCREVNWLLVTQGESGMSLFSSSGQTEVIPAHERGITDVTGAGDTALAVLTHSWACKLYPLQCAQLANAAASIAVTHLGCAQVDLAQIIQSLFDQNADHKIWSSISPFTLKALLDDKPVALISLFRVRVQIEHLEKLAEVLRSASANHERVVLSCSADTPCLHLLASLREIELIFVSDAGVKALQQSALRIRRLYWRENHFCEER